MAGNNYIILNSRFKPFSFQEMLAPAQMYTEAHNALETEYDNLDLLAADMASKLSENAGDANLRATYNTFKKDLESAQNDLATQGLNPATRKKLNSLKNRYATEINPIGEAYTKYAKDQETIRNLALTHPEIIVEGGGNSVSDYMRGDAPELTSVNLNDIYTRALKASAGKAAQMAEERNWTPDAGGTLLTKTSKQGMKEADLTRAISDFVSGEESSGSALLKDIIDPIEGSYSNMSAATRQRIRNAILSGVVSGFEYKEDSKSIANPTYEYNMRRQLAEDEARAKAVASAAAKRAEDLSRVGYSMYRSSKDYQSKVSDYIQSTPNGNYTTSEAIDVYFDSEEPDAVLKNREDMVEHNRKKASGTGGWAPRNSADVYNVLAFDRLVKNIEKAGLDPKTATREDIIERFSAIKDSPDAFGRKRASITTTDDDLVQRYLENALVDNNLVEIDGMKKDESGVFRYAPSKEVKLSDVLDKSGKIRVLSLDMDYATGERTITLQDKDGKHREFLMPKDMAFKTEDNEMLEMKAASLRELNAMVASGDLEEGVLYEDANGNIFTVESARQQLKEEMDLIFVSILNYLGKNNIN